MGWLNCGEGPLIDAAEETLYSFWGLATRGLTTSVLMLWAYVSASNLVEGECPARTACASRCPAHTALAP